MHKNGRKEHGQSSDRQPVGPHTDDTTPNKGKHRKHFCHLKDKGSLNIDDTNKTMKEALDQADKDCQARNQMRQKRKQENLQANLQKNKKAKKDQQ